MKIKIYDKYTGEVLATQSGDILLCSDGDAYPLYSMEVEEILRSAKLDHLFSTENPIDAVSLNHEIDAMDLDKTALVAACGKDADAAQNANVYTPRNYLSMLWKKGQETLPSLPEIEEKCRAFAHEESADYGRTSEGICYVVDYAGEG